MYRVGDVLRASRSLERPATVCWMCFSAPTIRHPTKMRARILSMRGSNSTLNSRVSTTLPPRIKLITRDVRSDSLLLIRRTREIILAILRRSRKGSVARAITSAPYPKVPEVAAGAPWAAIQGSSARERVVTSHNPLRIECGSRRRSFDVVCGFNSRDFRSTVMV